MRLRTVRDLPGDRSLVQRYNAQLRQVQIDLRVARTNDLAVNTLLAQHESKTEQHATAQANRRVHRQTWTVGAQRRFGAVNDEYVAVAHRGCQARFLNP